MAVVAIANTSTYIQGGIEYSASVSGSNIVVSVRLYFRRTNSYSGSTSSSSVSQYICISGDPNNYNYSKTAAITVNGGQEGVWQGPYFAASRTFDSSRGGNTIYVGWKSVDNASGGYFSGGDVNVAITLPTASTPPTGLSVSNIVPDTESFAADVSVTGWGTGGTAASRYLELQCWTYDASSLVQPRRYQTYQTSSLSANITVSNSSSYTQASGPLNIVGNTRYTIGAYANNGAANTGSQRIGSASTLAYPASLQPTITSNTTATVYYSTRSDGGMYTKTYEYSLDNGSTWTTFATVSSGSASSGSFDLTGLSQNTLYTIKHRVTTTAGTKNGEDVTFSIPIRNKFYVPVNGEATKIVDLYGAEYNQGVTTSTIVNKLYGSEGGESKLVHQRFGHLTYAPQSPDYGIVYYRPTPSSPDSEIQSVEIANITEFNSLCNDDYAWSATLGNGSVTVCSSGESNIIVGIEIGGLITSIGDYFLRDCSEISMPIVVPGNVVTIGDHFIHGTSFDQPIVIENGVTSIGSYFIAQSYMFDQPIILPNSVTSIGDSFLQECDNFNSTLTLSNSLTSIGKNFLMACISFDQPLTLPNSVTSIGDYFMYYCINFNQPLPLSSSLATIGKSFLRECVAFNQSISLPNSLTSIGDYFLGLMENMVGTVNVGSLSETIIPATNYPFSSDSSSQPSYTTGIRIAGANRSAWIARFPDRTSFPYRKLIDAGS